jgi:ubiquinone/menaquinone biosynthesis C-methylase UbiE
MPIEHKEFWSRVARKYDDVVELSIGPNTRAMVRDRLAEEGQLGRTAEFACGTGFYTEVLASKAETLVATDLSPGMLDLTKEIVTASNVTYQLEDCHKTSFPAGAFDTVFMSLVLHFTEPAKALAEMRRILKPGGTLIISNVDPDALNGWDRFRSSVRVIYYGITRYRIKPPKDFGSSAMTEKELCDLLVRTGFKVASTETFRNTSSSAYFPLEYVKAVKL